MYIHTLRIGKTQKREIEKKNKSDLRRTKHTNHLFQRIAFLFVLVPVICLKKREFQIPFLLPFYVLIFNLICYLFFLKTWATWQYFIFSFQMRMMVLFLRNKLWVDILNNYCFFSYLYFNLLLIPEKNRQWLTNIAIANFGFNIQKLFLTFRVFWKLRILLQKFRSMYAIKICAIASNPTIFFWPVDIFGIILAQKI